MTPEQAFFAAAPVRVEFRFTSSTPSDVSVAILGAKGEVRRLELKGLGPGTDHAAEWDGMTASGGAAPPDGRYRVLIGPPGGQPAEAGALTLRGHHYPVLGRHSFRGAIGRFGVGRSGGRVHEGFDINAACGRPLVAARGGVVVRRGFDPVLYGNFILVRGLAENRTYFYSHLRRSAEVTKGQAVLTGQRVGRVGRTGNARSVGCHLHFEIRRGGRPIDPQPELRRWDRFS